MQRPAAKALPPLTSNLVGLGLGFSAALEAWASFETALRGENSGDHEPHKLRDTCQDGQQHFKSLHGLGYGVEVRVEFAPCLFRPVINTCLLEGACHGEIRHHSIHVSGGYNARCVDNALEVLWLHLIALALRLYKHSQGLSLSCALLNP